MRLRAARAAKNCAYCLSATEGFTRIAGSRLERTTAEVTAAASASNSAQTLKQPPKTGSSESIATRYWENALEASTLRLFERHFRPSHSDIGSTGQTLKENPMKKLVIAVALVIASASPVLAEGFPNVYMTR